MIRLPPWPIILIVVFDVWAAAGSPYLLGQFGMVAAAAQFVVFASLAYGIWRRKKWAWITESILAVVQLLLLAVALLIAYRPDSLSLDGRDLHQFIAYMAALILINGFIVAALFLPSIRGEFFARRV